MTLNTEIFTATVEAAKAAASNSPSWLRAIEKAAEGLQGAWIVTELADGLMITTESGETYHANGVCQCKAFAHGQPCKHRAAARLWNLYQERLSAAPDRFAQRDNAPLMKREGNAVVLNGWSV